MSLCFGFCTCSAFTVLLLNRWMLYSEIFLRNKPAWSEKHKGIEHNQKLQNLLLCAICLQMTSKSYNGVETAHILSAPGRNGTWS